MAMGIRSTIAVLLITALSLAVHAAAQSSTGIIGGMVLDTDGLPLSGIMVVTESVPDSTVRGRPVRTDSMGRYQLEVGPGRYRVKAGGCPQGAPLDPVFQPCPEDARIYLYHPGTPNRATSAVVSIEPGTSREDVNFVLDRSTVAAMQQEGARLQSVAGELWRLRSYAPATTSSWQSLEAMHSFHVAAFIATPGMGSGRMFGMILRIDPDQRLLLPNGKKKVWSVKELDLIGIAKHEHPVVFSRISHGVYAESDRALTSFEQQAIAALRSGKDVVSGGDDADSMLVVGAIRATPDCLGCHRSAGENGLLGAFRYILQQE